MKRLLALMLLAAALSPAPAAAQEPGPELDRFYFRTAAGPRALLRIADCVINRHPQEARAMFEHDFGSAEMTRATEVVYGEFGNCAFSLRGFQSSGLMAMGALAEQLIREDKVASPPPYQSASFAGGGSFRWQWQGLDPDKAELMVPLAQCLLARHGAKVQAVLDERPNANGERTAFNAMRAEIADCIPLGEERVLQPQQLRAAMAEAYYRASRAGRAGGGVQ